MPRTKETRNPFGTIEEKQIVMKGKKRKVWDVRKRYAAQDADGNFLLDSKGKKIYREKTRRCYSLSEAQTALMSMPAEIREKQEKEKLEELKHRKKLYTFRELVARFRKTEVKPAVIVGGRKISGYKQDLENVKRILDLFENYFGDRIISEFTYHDLESFRSWYAERHTKRDKLPSVSTINEKMSFLRRLFNFAIEIYWLDVSPFQRGKSLVSRSSETVRNRMLTFDEEKRLLAACTDYKTVTFERKNRKNYKKGEGTEEVTQRVPVGRKRLGFLIICALDTAMRRGEIFNLEWWQIDFDRKVIYLTREAAAATKTGKGGVLPMTQRLETVLSEIYNNSGGRRGKNDKVFEHYDFRKAFESACRDAKIDDLQFRDLRSTGATRMVLAGNAESQVMKVTRHTQLKTFLEHYSNVDIINAQNIGKNLDIFLENQQSKGNIQGHEKSGEKGKAA